MLKILDLFSGIGGFSYAAEVLVGGFKTIGFCEYDKKCQEVLKLRFPGVPIYPDIRELNEETLADTEHKRCVECQHEGQPRCKKGLSKGSCSRESDRRIAPIHADIITGGYPCQPFSQAGKRGGEDDDRHLWPEMFRVIQLVKPTYVICENVAGHISMGLDSVLSDLESEGYRTEVFVLPACAVDAKHRRDRVWIMAHSRYGGRGDGESGGITGDVSGKLEKGVGATETVKASRPSEASGAVSISSSQRCDNGGNNREERHILQNINRDAEKGKPEWCGRKRGTGKASEDVAYTVSQRGRLRDTGREDAENVGESSRRKKFGEWLPESSLGRVAHGIPNRVDRLKQLGNSIVPQVAAQLFRAIKEIENDLA